MILFAVQLLSHVWLSVTPWTAACQASLFFTVPWSLLKLMSTESVMPSYHLILHEDEIIPHPILLLPSIFPSIRVFSSELALCIRRPKYWSFSFSICPSNEYSGLISFRIDWLDLLAVQGTLESFLQHISLFEYLTFLNVFKFCLRSFLYICKFLINLISNWGLVNLFNISSIFYKHILKIFDILNTVLGRVTLLLILI